MLAKSKEKTIRRLEKKSLVRLETYWHNFFHNAQCYRIVNLRHLGKNIDLWFFFFKFLWIFATKSSILWIFYHFWNINGQMVIYRLKIAKKIIKISKKYFLRYHKLAVLQHCAIVWIGICPRELRDSCRTYVFNLYPTSFFCHKFFELLCRALASWMSYMYAQLLVRFWILTKFLGMHSLQKKNWCTNGDNPRKLSNLLWSPNHPSPFPLLV